MKIIFLSVFPFAQGNIPKSLPKFQEKLETSRKYRDLAENSTTKD